MGLVHRKVKKKTVIITSIMLLLALIIIGFLNSNKVKDLVTVEAGAKTLDVSDFIKNKKDSGSFVTDLSEIKLDVPGTYDIKIKIGKKTYSSIVEVEDTVAPKGEVVNKETWVNEKISAGEFVQNVVDATVVNIYFAKEPNFGIVGQQEVEVVLEDAGGNKTQLKAMLNIKEDTEPPEIIGVEDQTIYIGDTISYRRNITVADNKDEDIDLEIDSSSVNLKKAGSYKVLYSATDSSGNTATQTAMVHVREKPVGFVTEEELNNLTDQVLASILKDNMSEIDKLWAIYKWTRKHIVYTGDSDKTNWMKEAARGIRNGRGDCFTYYATSKALITRAGFENTVVFRDTNTSFHSWNLVKVGDKWYHFDTTVSRSGYYYVCFLRTDAEVLKYSEWCKDYFKFDQSKYPATPTEPLQHPRNL